MYKEDLLQNQDMMMTDTPPMDPNGRSAIQDDEEEDDDEEDEDEGGAEDDEDYDD